MKVYEFYVTEGQEWALPLDGRDYEIFAGFDGTQRIDTWNPPKMYIVHEDEGETLGYSDMPWLGGHAPIMRRTAVDVLGNILSSYGEMLPLACEEAELWVFNTCTLIDALDFGLSEVQRFSSGGIMRVKRYAFKERSLAGVQVFRLPQFLRGGSVFVNHDVVDLVERSQLQRVSFRLLWDSQREL